MRFSMKVFRVFMPLLFLAGCGGGPVQETAPGAETVPVGAGGNAPKDSIPGTVLIFHEKEPDNEGHRVVFFVNPDIMRINDWQEVDDFILFDRKTQTIYNVVKKDATILMIKPRPVDIKSPLAYEIREEKQKSAAAASANGNDAFHYKYMIGDRECYNAVSLDGYQEDVVAALKEFRTVLAGEHAKTIGSTPVEMLDACDLAMNIFEPTRYIEKGFPLREWDSKGYQRFLVDVRNNVVSAPELMVLPETYQRYEITGGGH